MIKFKTIKWKNLLSTGNYFTEIDFTSHETTLILGKNGSGKSTVLDALTFVLFGKPYRKINKPQLINSINNADLIVEIDFTSNKKDYKIIRGMKPNVFEIYCDGKLIDQNSTSKDYQEHLEKFILKFNYKSFTQVVILGSASFVPFMQLVPGDRRTIIEELLDIRIFSSMNNIIKNKLADIKEKQKDSEYSIKLTNEKIEIQKQNVEENKKNSKLEVLNKRTEVKSNNLFVDKTTKEIEIIESDIVTLNEKISDEKTVTGKNTKYLTLESKLEDNVKKALKEISFYEKNDNCPTCHQEITAETKKLQVEEKKNKIQEIETAQKKLQEELQKIEHRISDIEKIQKTITEKNSEIVRLNTQIKETNKRTNKILKEIEELENKNNQVSENNSKLIELNNDLDSYKTEYEKLSVDKQYHEFSALLLKDTGIKTKIIKQYLPIMNKLINKYLSSMDFFVNFNLNENFEETIKSRFRDEFSYASFSEGEKQKIDIALLLTWRQVAKLKNSTNTNLLILDEIFDSSLDTNSVDLLLNILTNYSKETNIFVISHKGDQLFDKFKNVIRFSKKNNFSQVEK